jgi:hypothetical protein
MTRPEPEHDVQGLSITWPRPWQFGQVRSSVEKPCACRALPWPAHNRTGLRLGARLCATAGAGFADDGRRNADPRGLARKGFEQRDFHIVAPVGAALAAGAAAAPPAHAEQVVENIREGRGEIGAEAVGAVHAVARSNAAWP